MSLQQPARLRCPYCGEYITLLIDTSAGDHECIEDCHVCCRPIQLEITTQPQLRVVARHEHE